MRFTNLIGPVGELRAISTAAGGTALTAAAQFVAFPPGTEAYQVVARNFASGTAVQLIQCPWLAVLKTSDSFAAEANTTDYSAAAQDGSVSTDVVLSSLATTGAVWVGSHVPFRGIAIDVDAPNGTANTAAATYWNGTTMASLSITDGTANGGAAFAVDGNITWTIPSDWAGVALSTAAAIGSGVSIPRKNEVLYWVRFTVSAANDSSTTLNSIMGMNRSTAYFELVLDAPELSLQVKRGTNGHAGLELKTDAGTANVIINVMTSGFFV